MADNTIARNWEQFLFQQHMMAMYKYLVCQANNQNANCAKQKAPAITYGHVHQQHTKHITRSSAKNSRICATRRRYIHEHTDTYPGLGHAQVPRLPY